MARTDNDSWDLTSSVGATATSVAASRAMASQGPNPLLDHPGRTRLFRAVGIDTFIKLIDGEIGPTDDDPVLSRRNMREQMTVRTRYFDDFFVQATNSGIRQAVILASGRTPGFVYRLPWPAGTVVYEIDQPEVIEFKTRTLAGLGAEPTGQRRTVAIDLRDDWPAGRCERPALTRGNQPHGALKVCWCTCPPMRRTGCSTTSPPCSLPAAGSPLSTWT